MNEKRLAHLEDLMRPIPAIMTEEQVDKRIIEILDNIPKGRDENLIPFDESTLTPIDREILRLQKAIKEAEEDKKND
jgi:hypothetical protein